MISEFEQRLVEVLGTRLPAPFSGRVAVAGAPIGGTPPLLVAGVSKAEPADPQLGNQKPSIVPGSPAARRIARLKCTVEIRAAPEGGRPQQIAGLESALYVLDAPDFHTGSALVAPGDPGFLIERMQIGGLLSPVGAVPDPAAAGVLTLVAEGLFWPVGVAGETGQRIGEIRIRGLALPVKIAPPRPDAVAGGPPLDLRLSVGLVGAMQLNANAPAIARLPFEALAFALSGPGGRPGAGTLSGGVSGSDGVRFSTLSDGAATITYTPPAEPGTDQLVVGFDDGSGGLGVEIGRFAIRIREDR